MKTLNEGKIPENKPWWIGKTITCSHCRFKGELEESDEPYGFTEKSPNGKSWVGMKCPTCGSEMKLVKEVVRSNIEKFEEAMEQGMRRSAPIRL